jgi:hypothetical protein
MRVRKKMRRDQSVFRFWNIWEDCTKGGRKFDIRNSKLDTRYSIFDIRESIFGNRNWVMETGDGGRKTVDGSSVQARRSRKGEIR